MKYQFMILWGRTVSHDVLLVFYLPFRKLEIVELKLKADSSKHHSHSLCSKKSLDTCQNKFQGHVRAVSSDKDATDKQDLWCEVLSVGRSFLSHWPCCGSWFHWGPTKPLLQLGNSTIYSFRC